MPTRKKQAAEKPSKQSSKGQRPTFHPLSNLPGNDLPPGPPNSPGPWRPYEIVLIKWQLSRAASPVQPSIDPGASGIYSHMTLLNDPQGKNYYLNNIQQFAMDVDSGSVTLAKEPLHTTASGTGPCEFVVWYPCYVVFALEFGYWRFQEGIGSKALNTGYVQATPTYTDLNHLLGVDVYPSVGNNQCQVAYFSVGSSPNTYSVMPFNLFFDYVPIQPPFNYTPNSFDPAIKNDGHTPPMFYGRKKK